MRNKFPSLKILLDHHQSIGLIILIIALVGCTNSTPPVIDTPVVEDTPPPASTATPTQTPEITATVETPAYLEIDLEDLSGITVRFVHPWLWETAKALEEIAAEFTRSNNWDIRVEVAAYGGDGALVEALQADLDAGNLPGLIAAHPYLLSNLEGDYASVSLSDYFNAPDWGLDADAQADIPPVFLEQFTSHGELMALPLALQATVLFYNQTWAAELGYPSKPADQQDFRDQSCAATSANWLDDDQDLRGTGGWVLNLDPNVLASWFYAFGGSLSLDGTPEFNTTAGRAAFGYLKTLYDPPDGCIWVALEPYPYLNFANRLTLMYAGTLDQIPAQMEWLDVVESEDEWSVMGLVGTDGEVIVIDGSALMITADSAENQMAAWLFAKHLLEPDAQAKIVQTLFSLPVRWSAMESLSEFGVDFPQWMQGVALVDSAHAVPISDGWGIGQWVLQDAVYRLLQADASELPEILEELDAIIKELEEMAP
jgi:multiple sugar transport system substrate-binding protein